jgi:hypothetical protein
MAEENKTVDEVTEEVASEKKAKAPKAKQKAKKPNVFVRIGKWFAKVTKDTVGELKKVTWTPILNYEKRGTQVSGYPVHEYYKTLKSEKAKKALEDDMKKLYGVVTGTKLTGEIFREEYDLA